MLNDKELLTHLAWLELNPEKCTILVGIGVAS
jgi:hypothetical protein